MALILCPTPLHAWNTGHIKWYSYHAGLKQAQKTGRPILMVFSAPWCSKCKTYKRLFYNKKVVKLARQMVMVKINIQNNRKLQKQFSVDGSYIPRTLALSPEGYHYAELAGANPNYKYFLDYHNPGELIQVMRWAIARAN